MLKDKPVTVYYRIILILTCQEGKLDLILVADGQTVQHLLVVGHPGAHQDISGLGSLGAAGAGINLGISEPLRDLNISASYGQLHVIPA